jgi:hypothetical protein
MKPFFQACGGGKREFANVSFFPILYRKILLHRFEAGRWKSLWRKRGTSDSVITPPQPCIPALPHSLSMFRHTRVYLSQKP